MASYHVRSISLPSTSHPVIVNAEELLERLKSSHTTSSSSICHNMSDLVEFHDSVDDVLHLWQRQSHGNRVEEVLDGSLRMLDLCASIKDALSQTKENVQELESSLRRKRGDSVLSNEVNAYVSSRKKVSKLIFKIIGETKRIEKSSSTKSSQEKDSLSSIFKEIEGVSLIVFDSLLSYISQKNGRSKNLSFVPKLLQSKRVACEADMNEVEKLDMDLLSLKSKRSTQQVRNVVKDLQALEMNIREIEEGLEAVFRRLVKTRVSLLNILNN